MGCTCRWEAEEQTGAGQQWDWDFMLIFLWLLEQILPGAARTGHSMAVGEGRAELCASWLGLS